MRGRLTRVPAKELGLPKFQASKFSNTKQQVSKHQERFYKFSLFHSNLRNQQTSTMAGRRIAYVALPVAAAGGYYFYAAGGDSKVAQKKAERLSIGTHKESFE